jgi:long-chain acyl-CoA synthetase
MSDPITDELMSAGAEFEIATVSAAGRDLKLFKNLPKNLATAINAMAHAHDDLDLIVAGERRLTYRMFFEQVNRLARFLIVEKAVVPGQSVAIAMKNSPEWMVGFAAIALAGGVVVLVNSRGEGDTMRHAIEDSDAGLVLCDAARAGALSDAGCTVPTLIAPSAEWDAAIAYTGDAPLPERSTTDIAAMFFTSGTTGRAKAAAVSHRALLTGIWNTKLAMAAAFIKIAKTYGISLEDLKGFMPQACSLLVFPLFHVSGCTATFLTSLLSGGKLVLMDRWNGAHALELIAQEKVTTLGGVPAMLWDVLEAAQTSQADLSSLRSISCGGQGLPLGLLERLREQFPEAVFGAGYGMTEACGAVSQGNGDMLLQNPTASGQILPMCDVRIVDETGTDVATGEAGEIWVRGATLMEGYHNNPEATAASFQDGWYKTGDIGFLNEARLLTISDRKTDMVISMGENIYCAEVERLLSQNAAIREVVTFGVPDDRMGEKLIACVYSEDTGLTREALRAFAESNMAAYKIPVDFVIQHEPFSHNAMGKVEKHKLRRNYLGDA